MTSGEKWLAIGVSLATLLGGGAHVVARFNTLENSADTRAAQLVEEKLKREAMETRVLTLERSQELRDRIADIREDIARLSEKVDNIGTRVNALTRKP